MEPPIGDMVDLDRYPIHELAGEPARRLVAGCRARLAETGAVRLDGFVRPDAIPRLVEQARLVAPLGFPNDDTHNVYFTDIDESLPDGDPRRLRVRSAQKAVAMDLLPEDFGVKRIYGWDGLVDFVAAALGKEQLFRSDDPLDGCNMTV